MPIVGPINNWTWVGFSANMGKKFCDASSNVIFNSFNKINSDLDYFNVSHKIEIMHLNDSNEFENEINKQFEKQIEPMEPTFETINLGNDESPLLIKIGLTLNEKERKYLQKLTEFQEAFAWSYEDMPRIDPKIAQHHIDTHNHMVPIKQNLRRMSTECLLKIKEEVTKQLKVGFITTVHQAEWIANVVPVPKKDGKLRMCVDFRDLNKACLKDDFPLLHINVLVVCGKCLDVFHGWFFGVQPNQDSSQRYDQNHYHYIMGNLLLYGDAI